MLFAQRELIVAWIVIARITAAKIVGGRVKGDFLLGWIGMTILMCSNGKVTEGVAC